jgi:alkaline phosphatase D
MLTRRDFLASSLALGAYPLVGRTQNASSNPVFRHGVASGDPLTDRVILWTRVTPATRETGSIEVEWTVARNPDMSRVVGRGSIPTSAERDYTVKIDASALEPGATYYYRFTARGEESPIGRTRTIATGTVNRARFALTSCANLPFGYFNVYARIAELQDLDAVLHLGDYIYEYGNANYGNRPGVGDGTKFGRVPRPNREILQLNDYRARYAQYREDADLQEVHRQHPFIVIWDDHEFANNAWRGGAGNHNAGEGEWTARRRAAEQAWREWMPARMTTTEVRGYRQFTFGGLADLFMLDTRVAGRDQQTASANDVASLERASRQLLGTTQEQWLFGGLRDSVREKRPWQILGQQVMFAPQVPDMQRAAHTDTWDGYRAARNRVFDAVASAGVSHLVVLTGDVHSSWAYDLARDPFNPATYDPQTGRGAMGTEIIAPAVTSPTSITPDRLAGIRSSRPHLKFVEVEHRGYAVVEVTRERLQADWWFVPTIGERTTAQTRAKTLVTEAAKPRLVEVG